MIFMSRLCTVVNTFVAPCTTISRFSGIASGVHQATNTWNILPIYFHPNIRSSYFSYRLVSGAERKLRVEMAADKDHFLVAEPHLAPRVAGHIYPAEEDLLLVLGALW